VARSSIARRRPAVYDRRFYDHHILAIKPDGLGNVTKTHIAWRTNKGAAYVPSPIIEGEYFLIVSDSGVAHCFEAATGSYSGRNDWANTTRRSLPPVDWSIS
jgi:hypothetical protein